ncbi:MAG: hypothetical protein M3P06_23825 [Acidobacteriota bacterium]|nr:hypothetical protein [Acidobacteriota bacterium]
MSPFPAWHFREMDRGEINVDPVHDEFFKAQDLADALVREAIQNSLDARRGHSRVRVRFRFAVDDQALAPEVAAKYLRGLQAHLDVVAPHLQSALPDLAGPMPFLLIEDSGTRGLTGDPGSDPELDADDGARNDFYYFWRNVGRSGKGEMDRGRWGLGKAVFSVSSRIHTIFGLTLRVDDERRLLLGQSVLKTHILNGHRRAPYGFLANVGDDSFPHALADENMLDRFVADFGLQRAEPGLSIVVPFHRDDDLRFEQLVASVVRQYFYPITRGDLVVTVEENGVIETISQTSIDGIATRYATGDSLSSLCALTRWSVLLGEEEWIEIPEPLNGAPKWREDAIAPDTLELLRRRFEAGDRLAFRVHVPVRRKRSRAASSWFAVILEKDEQLKRGEHHFIRRGITIPEVKSPRDKPVRAILVADDDALSTFLGDAENPAHSDWSERNDKIRNVYENGAYTLRYVKNAIAQLAALVTTPPAGRAPDLLAEIFSVTIANNGDQSGARRPQGPLADAATGAEMQHIPIKSHEQRIKITPVSGGFALRGSGSISDVGVAFVAEVAYRTRNGNPFRKYNAFDFTIGEDGIVLSGDGATIRALQDNRLEFLPTKPDFHLALVGFDARRDLVVRLSRKDDDAAETELH